MNTIRSLRELNDDYGKEFVFVDDKSTDNSLQIIHDETKGMENVVIHSNIVNSGPAVTTNVGAKLCRGEYIFFLDSDDMFAPNAMKIMGGFLEKTAADALFFDYISVTSASGYDVVKPMPDDIEYEIIENPKLFVKDQNVVGPTWGIHRNLLKKLGNVCNEKVFIQDASMTLNISNNAKKLLILKTPALYYIYDIANSAGKLIPQSIHDKSVIFHTALADGHMTERKYFRAGVKQIFKVHHKNCYKSAQYKNAAKFYIYRRSINWLSKPFMVKQLKQITDYYRTNFNVRFVE